MKASQLFLIVIAAISAIVFVNAAFTVKETEQAMVLTFGKIDRIITTPGLHFKTPFYQQVMQFDKRILETDSKSEEVQSADKKRVVVDSFTRWRIADAKKFYEAVRTVNNARAKLDTIINSSIRNVVAREKLLDLISGDRDRMMREILAESEKEAAPLGIEIVDVRIKRADLPEANSRAVFSRMRAEREKEAKEIRAQGSEEAQKIRAGADKERVIILANANRDAEKMRGEGDAKAIETYAKAFQKDERFYALSRSMEAYRNALSDSGTLLILDQSVKFMEHFNNPSK